MTLEALIFDLDGTLVDTAPDLHAATNHVLGLIDRQPISMAELRAFVGHGAMNLIERGVAATGDAVDQDTLKQLHKQFLEYYGDNISDHSVVFDGVLAVLDKAAARGLKMGVCTNKVEKLSHKLLTELNMMQRFGSLVGGDTLPVMKPDPAPLIEAATRLGVTPQNIMMVGDSETDIRTAQNAGVPVLAVSFGYTSQHVSAFSPTHVIDHYDEAWAIIETYLS
jgi:phosphoglycolate phosphatase